MTPATSSSESDPRFPSGRWIGFFVDKRMPGKHWMDLRLTFAQGVMTGDGHDRVGAFTINGSYKLDDGLCIWTKKYPGSHDIFYRGFNEGKGIWGTWELNMLGIRATGGFHIWPDGMPDPSEPHLAEEADEPVTVEKEELVPATINIFPRTVGLLEELIEPLSVPAVHLLF